MAGIRSEKVQMSPADRASFERRVCRAYKSGVSYEDMRSVFRLRPVEIVAIVKKFPDVQLRQPGSSRKVAR